MATKTKERRERDAAQEELELTTHVEQKKPAANGGNGKASEKKTVFSHETKKRCRRCGAMMRAVKTSCGGELKHWECTAPVCRATLVSSGVKI